jgi:membrane protein DedA with SNARE-associated domain
MMRLIEKIVDKFLNDEDYAIIIAFISLPALSICILLGMTIHRNRLDHELKLAMIAAGQVIECDCSCKSKSK